MQKRSGFVCVAHLHTPLRAVLYGPHPNGEKPFWNFTTNGMLPFRDLMRARRGHSYLNNWSRMFKEVTIARIEMEWCDFSEPISFQEEGSFFVLARNPDCKEDEYHLVGPLTDGARPFCNEWSLLTLNGFKCFRSLTTASLCVREVGRQAELEGTIGRFALTHL